MRVKGVDLRDEIDADAVRRIRAVAAARAVMKGFLDRKPRTTLSNDRNPRLYKRKEDLEMSEAGRNADLTR